MKIINYNFGAILLIFNCLFGCQTDIVSQSIISSDNSVVLDFVSSYNYSSGEYYFQDTTVFREIWISNDFTQFDSMSVVLTDYPSDYIHTDSSFTTISEFISSTNPENETYTLVTLRYEWVKGYPGLHFRMRNMNDNSILVKRVHLVGGKMIEIQYTSEKWFKDKDDDIFESIILDAPNNKIKYKIPTSIDCGKFDNYSSGSNREIYVPSEYGLSLVDININEIESNTSKVNMEMVSIASYLTKPDIELSAFYDKAIQGMASSTKSEIKTVDEISINGKKGRKVELYSDAINLWGHYIIWLDEKCLYSIGALTTDKSKIQFDKLVKKLNLDL